MIRFGYVITYVADVEESLRFFESAFGLKRRFLHDEGDYGELETGSTVIAFASESLGNTNLPSGFVAAAGSEKPLGIEIALVTDDVQTHHASALEQGATELRAPEKKPWGQTVSYVRSPAGILIELCTPVGG